MVMLIMPKLDLNSVDATEAIDAMTKWSNMIAGKLGSDRASEVTDIEASVAFAIAEALRAHHHHHHRDNHKRVNKGA